MVWLLRGFRLPAIAMVAVLAALLAATHVAGSTGPSGQQSYLQLNMCGNACNHGRLPVVRNLETVIEASRPFTVTLNEVCENQYDELRHDLPAYRGRFDPTGPVCTNGSRYGNAILARTSDVELVGTWPLPNPDGGETRRLMCLSVRSPDEPSLVTCVTHLSYVRDEIAAQIRTVAEVLQRLSRTRPVVLGGDLNTVPTDGRLDPLYSAPSGCGDPGAGSLEEADSLAGRSRAATDPTFSRNKIDYIFLSTGGWSGIRASVFDAAGGLSDHSALWATGIPMLGGRRPEKSTSASSDCRARGRQ